MYKGQNAKRTVTAKNSGGAMKRAENEDETSSVFISVQQMPSFPGGETARTKFLARNLRYPTQAVEDGVQGTVYVTFVVKTNGSLADIKILRGIGGGCDEEAFRVVKKMPSWYPGYQNGRNVPVRYTLKVDFKIK
jgi:protein TonB